LYNVLRITLHKNRNTTLGDAVLVKLSRSDSAALPVRWAAKMIAPLADKGQGTAASFVAKVFDLAVVERGLTLNISAQGLYRCFINGNRVGQDLLTPGWTCYDNRIAYQSYDVSQFLRVGKNKIDIWLADGWWRSQLLWALNPIYNCWGDRIGAIAQIQDGKTVLVETNDSWESGTLPVTKSGIYYGEDFDARLENLSTSDGVEVLTFKTKLLVPHETSPVRELEAIVPVESWTESDGRTVHDFGQNAAGYVRYTVEGERGAIVTIDHSEILGPNKHFDNRNYRSARAQSVYTLKGGGPETYKPMFTFMGFRYARVAISGKAKITAIDFVPISSVPELAGGFTCGVPAVNRLVQNTIWSQRSNFIEVPTDCPQRDERIGWTGDAQVFAGTACWLADCETFLKKYLRDVMVDQRKNGAIAHFSPDPTRLHPIDDRGDWAGATGWGDAIVVIPWQLYLQYGKTEVLKECFPAMLKWLDYLWNISNGPIIRPPSIWGTHGFTFGDWIQPVGDNRKPRPTIADDCAATLYHAISTQLAANIAKIIGDKKQASLLKKRSAEIKTAFGREYFSATGRMAHADQTSYSLAFLYDLVPKKYESAAKAYFRQVIVDAQYLIGTGFIGTPALLPALSKLGMDDLAEKVFLNREVPGWLYQVDRGATTIWERWDAQAPDGSIYDPDMNSYNHYAYGSVCQWLFEQVAGVGPDAAHPGFDRVIIEPHFIKALSPVTMWHQSRHGKIMAKWTLKGGQARYTLTLPDGTTGLVAASDQYRVTHINGKAAKPSKNGIALPPGSHEIMFRMTTDKPKTKGRN
jgi:alpha-L-rhamnosidase